MRTEARAVLAAVLPEPRGPLSAAVVSALRDGGLPSVDVAAADPFGADLAVALHTCYELHYQGFRDVDPDWEWSPSLLAFRRELERVFEAALRAAVPAGDATVATVLDELLVEPVPGTGVSHFLRDEGEWWQFREYVVHRSIYHHKEADPHALVIPRLSGQAKAALVAVEFDEFGGGHGDRVHAQLYRDLMAATGLDDGYLRYFDDVPAPVIAVVNMMSMFGLHRRLRAAMVGHFAAAEITTAPSAARLVKAVERLGGGPDVTHFFAEHVEADAVHEQVLRHDVVGDLLDREPDLAADVVFGVQATEFLESRFGDHVLTAWRAGHTSLLTAL
ncbi:iron-containing redox enzyme family protein [Actinophytocola sp. NPDC049390]|uniref:iron-containing redox enzyme family protein n=1 Tax=Actinophytocola sp. NPDC049390 TaxID=3363894 RepID=UPI0037A0AFCD